MSRPVDRRLLRSAPASRRLITTLAAMQAVGGALILAQAILLAGVVVAIFGGHPDRGSVLARLALLAVVGSGRAALAGVQEALVTRASVTVRAQLRRSTLTAVVGLGPAWARRQPPGRLVTVTGPGLDALDGYVTRAVPALVSAVVLPVFALVAIFVADWQCGVILLVLLPLVPVFMVLIGITTGRLIERQYLALARLSGQFLDLVRGLTTLRIYGRAASQERTLQSATQAYRVQTIATLRIALLSGLVLDLLAALSVAVVAVDIGLRLAAGNVSFMTALVVLLLAPEVFAPLRAVGAQHHATQEGGVAATAALDIVEEAGAVVGEPAAVRDSDPVHSIGRIVLDSVSVVYPGRFAAALQDVSLTVEPGSVVVLCGVSGAGKSTVLAALLGFAPATQGGIQLDTVDGRRTLDPHDAESWRANLAWLPQRPRSSRPTVADEIRLGDPSAADHEVAAVADQCRTPDLFVPLGEDGRGVSAGERRRIGLARVLLRARAVQNRGDTPVVLLDEPSEDLDRDTEQVVVEFICALAGWATVLVATHSPRIATLADRRIELADGRVVESRSQHCVRSPTVPVPARVHAEARTALPDNSPVVDFALRDLVRDAGATRRLLAATALSAASALTALGLTASSLWLISRAAQHPNVQALSLAVVGVRTFAIARALLRYTERLVTHDSALLMLAALRVRVFAALRPLSPSTLGTYGRGDLLRRFVGDVDGAQEGLVRALVPASGAAVGALGAVTLAAFLAPMAGVLLATGLVIAGVVVPVLGYRFAGDASALVSLAGRRDLTSASLIDALDEVVAYGDADRTLDAVSDIDAAVESATRRLGAVAGAGVVAGGAIAALTLSGVLAIAVPAMAAGTLPVVGVAVLVGCVLSGFESVATLPSAFVAWTRCRAGLRRVSEVISREPALHDPDPAQPVPDGALGLVAVGVELAPVPGARPVLIHANLHLPAGRRVAVVGPSGCGKSTVLAAAVRMVGIDAGSLALTGSGRTADLRDVAVRDVPPAVAGSLQGDHVFDSTLRDDLRFVRPAATDADLDAVAARVGLLTTIRALPAGWSTPAGPDGCALSGGQRQRLLVARALLADPAVLVLDEPTAHLDAQTEHLVLADILDATSGRTVLLTTHRQLTDGQVDAIARITDREFVRGDEDADADRALDVVASAVSM